MMQTLGTLRERLEGENVFLTLYPKEFSLDCERLDRSFVVTFPPQQGPSHQVLLTTRYPRAETVDQLSRLRNEHDLNHARIVLSYRSIESTTLENCSLTMQYDGDEFTILCFFIAAR